MACQGARVVAAARSGVAGSIVSGGSGSVFGDEMFEEEENPCTVCLGELETGATSKLDCGHIYHTEVCHHSCLSYHHQLLPLSCIIDQRNILLLRRSGIVTTMLYGHSPV